VERERISPRREFLWLVK